MDLKIPVVKAREVIKVLKEVGFIEARQTGSHKIMKNPISGKIISVPIHSKPLKKGLLRSIIKEAKLTKKEFIEFLKRN